MSSVVHVPAQEFPQIREIVTTYVGTRRGDKGCDAKAVGVGAETIRQWAAALADGDMDNDKIPRKTGRMTRDDVSDAHPRATRSSECEVSSPCAHQKRVPNK